MRKSLALCLGTFVGILFAGESALAQSGHGSSKTTAVVADLNYLEVSSATAGTPVWAPIMVNTIKVSNKTDLFVDVSLESSLHTRTLVKSKGGNKDTSTASASIRVRVLVDGLPAYPHEGVVFNARTQELTAVFQGIFIKDDGSTCLEADLDTGAITVIEECLEPEELELILQSMSANAFNFLVADLESGVHEIEVQAMIEVSTDSQEGEAEAIATVGHGSLTVDAVRMLHDEEFEF